MEQENYEYIKFLTEETFKNQNFSKNIFYDEIPESLKSSFNENLDFDFRENIEYLLLYDDSLDGTGKQGIAIVKNRENYYILIKGYRKEPVIFFLHSEFERWEINRFYVDKEGYTFTIATDLDANVINGEQFYSLGEEVDAKFIRDTRFYVFRFYNLVFLDSFVELCERINDEVG